MKEFSLIICASPRSGSYFLLDLLEQAGLPHGEEWLTDYHRVSGARRYGKDPDPSYIEYLRLLSAGERKSGGFVLKAMYPQFKELAEVLTASGKKEACLPDRIADLFPNPRYVFLKREDKIAQAISHFKARQTGRWVNHGGRARGDRFDPSYSFLGIIHQFNERAYSENQWEAFFADSGIEPLRLTYETVRRDPADQVKRLFNWLELGNPERDPDQTGAKVAPMSTSANKEWRTRFEADQAHCRDILHPEDNARLANLAIREASFGDSLCLSDPNRFQIVVESHAGQPIDFRGTSDGKGWLRISGSLQGPGGRDWFQQELRETSPHTFTAEGILPIPKAPGRYTLQIALTDRVLSYEAIASNAALTREIAFTLPDSRQPMRQLFGGIEDLDNGWQHLKWFGYFMDEKFPWVYHAEHEWLFFKSEADPEGRVAVLDANLGWFQLDPSTYPVIHSLERKEQWRFLESRDGTRHFEIVESGERFTAETNRPDHLENLKTD